MYFAETTEFMYVNIFTDDGHHVSDQVILSNVVQSSLQTKKENTILVRKDIKLIT
jgi:hypothetical protein